MTVKELVDLLNKFDSDAQIVVSMQEKEFMSTHVVTDVKVAKPLVFMYGKYYNLPEYVEITVD